MPTTFTQPLESRSRGSRYESLDLWRGVACLLVLVNHGVFYDVTQATAPRLLDYTLAVAAARMWAGVPIFFVISGYCISATIEAHRRKHLPISQYFLKRLRRIFPPYWVVLVATAITVGILDLALGGALSTDAQMFRPWWFSGWQWAGSISLTELWRYHLAGDAKALYLGHAWTLCYEEQFYVVAGLLLFCFNSRWFRASLLTTGIVAATAVAATSKGVPVDGFFFDGSWVQFAMGILLFYVLNRGTQSHRLAAGAIFLATAIVAVALGQYALLERSKNVYQVYLVAAAFGLFALALHRHDDALIKTRALRPLHYCGMMCYSLYLVHLPVVVVIRGLLVAVGIAPSTVTPLVSLALCSVPALSIAWLFHCSVERRFMSPARERVRVDGHQELAMV